MADASKGTERLLERARKDPAWHSQLGALENYLRGNYKVHKSDRTTSKMGYDCWEVRSQVGTVFRATAFVASNDQMPLRHIPWPMSSRGTTVQE